MNDPATTIAPGVTSHATDATVLAPSPFPVTAHVLMAIWVATMVLLGINATDTYESLLQEDRFIEWWTVPLFAMAGVFALRRAIRERRIFDALVGVFCIFVAGEEFSWGQRLLGLTPPAAFLEHNYQQELTIHNFADLFGQPKTVLILALAGFGILLPVAALSARGRQMLGRVGATSPPLPATPAAPGTGSAASSSATSHVKASHPGGTGSRAPAASPARATQAGSSTSSITANLAGMAGLPGRAARPGSRVSPGWTSTRRPSPAPAGRPSARAGARPRR